LKPEPWIDVVLLLINILFAGTIIAQWTDRGRDIAVGALSLYVLLQLRSIRDVILSLLFQAVGHF
jgi:hypothetical protein